MELDAEDVAVLDRRGEDRAVRARRDATAAVTGAAYECVKYTWLPSSIPSSNRERRGACSEFQPTCGTLSAPLSSRGSREQTPAMAPSPLTPGASSLPSNSHCMPEADAEQRRAAFGRAPDGRGPRAVERRGRAEVPDARDDDAVDAGELGWVGGREQIRAGGGKPLADRREIARAVIDERDHRSPLVLGSIRAMRAIARARDAQRRGRTP